MTSVALVIWKKKTKGSHKQLDLITVRQLVYCLILVNECSSIALLRGDKR